jgi:hypothetical protein
VQWPPPVCYLRHLHSGGRRGVPALPLVVRVNECGVVPVQPLVTCEACGSASVGPPGVLAPVVKECRADPLRARTSPAIPGERARSLRLGPPCVPTAQQQRFARSALGRFVGAHLMHWSFSTPRRASLTGHTRSPSTEDRRKIRLVSASSPAYGFESEVTMSDAAALVSIQPERSFCLPVSAACQAPRDRRMFRNGHQPGKRCSGSESPVGLIGPRSSHPFVTATL